MRDFIRLGEEGIDQLELIVVLSVTITQLLKKSGVVGMSRPPVRTMNFMIILLLAIVTTRLAVLSGSLRSGQDPSCASNTFTP